MQQIVDILSIALQEGLVYACVGFGVWLSFRVLAFPDLSAEGSFPLGAAVAAVLITQGYDPLFATICSMLAGLIVGMSTAILSTDLRVNKLLSGILTATAMYSINMIIMDGSNITLLRQTTLFNGTARVLGIEGRAAILLIASTIVLITGVLLAAFLHTNFGVALRATGDNERMIRGLGVNTKYTLWTGLALANAMIALAGSLVAQKQGFADISMGFGCLVIGLAAIIIGERLILNTGVNWSIFAVVVGTVAYRAILSVSLRAGLSVPNLKLVTATLVILVLTLPNLPGSLVKWKRT
jgi:putative ABC transport system permease protein